ncbi:SHOCT domain-containing protein [Microlunatus sp. GCM10028923]|uniref:SHOCT domain-containing protein n=1 Tax=Microlunatus sp. GCM10028923 TaxID=3273400 RepID=UPI00360BCD1B
MMFWYGDGMGGWGSLLMTVSMVIFWGTVIFLVVALTRHLSRTQRPAAGLHTSAEQLLAERFARGELDEQEYRSRLNVLRHGPEPH